MNVNNNRIDINSLDRIIAINGMSNRNFCDAMGKSANWLTNMKSKYGEYRFNDVQMRMSCAILKCKKEEVLVDEAAEVVPEALPESDIEKEMRDFFKFAREELAAQKSILMYLYNCKQQSENARLAEEEKKKEGPKPEPKTELEKAMDVLTKMLEGVGAVRYAQYMLKLDEEHGIRDHRMADAAIAKLGHTKRTRGFGSNKASWVGKTAYFDQIEGSKK